jgi:hypothetical protein
LAARLVYAPRRGRVFEEYSAVSRFGTGEGKLIDRRIRVLLAADHAMFHQCIKEMLSTGEEIESLLRRRSGTGMRATVSPSGS